MRLIRLPPFALLSCFAATALAATALAAQPAAQPVTINTNFEGGSIGRVEPVDDTSFRCYIAGQTDERGHNRQGSWFFIRLDHVQGRELTLTLVYFKGEYHFKPALPSMAPGLEPVFSYDAVHWQPMTDMKWDEEKTEATLHFRPERDSIWLAHIPPYTPNNLKTLLEEISHSPDAVLETIGQSVNGRNLTLVTVTNPDVPDADKKTVWLMARQHAWESGTSWVMEGALRFITSSDPAARALRDKVIFKFSPMVDMDGSATGQIRFNANGYDFNMRWDEVDLRHNEFLRRMPEIWYHKKAILTQMATHHGHGIDLLINMHNTETAEFLQTQVDDPEAFKKLRNFDELLTAHTQYDPSRKIALNRVPPNTTNSLWIEAQIPACLMEQRTGASKKLGRRPTIDDRLTFGGQLIKTMGQAVLQPASP